MGPAVGSTGGHFEKFGGKFDFLRKKNKKKKIFLNESTRNEVSSVCSSTRLCNGLIFSGGHAMKALFFFETGGH